MADDPENLTLAHLQALRRDQAAMLEQIQTLARQMARIAETHVDVQRTMGDIKVTLTEMRSDILLLENLNITRHNEILGILHRLDETELQQSPAKQALDQDPSSDQAAIHIDDQ